MLNDTQCRNFKGEVKPYKKADSGGLYLLVKPNGNKLWRLKYRYLGKEKLLALGSYPIVTLAEAREARDKAKKLLHEGADPMLDKKRIKRDALIRTRNTFKAVALDWYDKQLDRWSDSHAHHVMRKMEIDLFPHIGNRPIAEIDAPELLSVLRIIEARGSLEVVSKVKQICGQVFRYGIATGKCSRDHTADLKGALKTGKVTHYPCIEINEIPEFLNALEFNDARLFQHTKRAVKLLMLTFVRTSELIHAKWDKFDFEDAEWIIPAERMKINHRPFEDVPAGQY